MVSRVFFFSYLALSRGLGTSTKTGCQAAEEKTGRLSTWRLETASLIRINYAPPNQKEYREVAQ
jgi:hypothetical protein